MKGQEQREQVSFDQYVGMGLVSVVGINPESNSDGEPIEYVKDVIKKFKGIVDGKVEAGVEKDVKELSLTFLLNVQGIGKTDDDGVFTPTVFRHTIRLYNTENVSYKDYENTGRIKYEWINSTGNTSWAFDESELKDRFTNFVDKNGDIIKNGEKTYRKALVGEGELFTFINAWLGDKIRKRWTIWSHDVDVNQLFKGNFSSLKSEINGEYAGQFVGMFYVETSEDGDKHYQKLFGKSFLRADYMKHINNGGKFPDEYSKKNWKYFTKQVESPDNIEYALSGFYEYTPIRKYNPEEDIATSSKAKNVTPVNDSY